MRSSKLIPLLLHLYCIVTFVHSECSDVSFSATSAQLGNLKRVQRISVSGHIAAYAVEISISDGEFDTVYQGNGNPLVSLFTSRNFLFMEGFLKTLF
ncbi:hypothetical protein V3C99_009068 [Haemonchus contortus]